MSKKKPNIVFAYIGLLASLLVGVGEFLLHYSPHLLETSEPYLFFSFVAQSNLSIGHFIAVSGIVFYYIGYIHVYQMLASGNKTLAQATMFLGFLAFTLGGLWIGSRSSIGYIVHLKNELTPELYQGLIVQYENHMEVLVQGLRVVVFLVSISFIAAILKGNTYYKKWMVFFNPITILIVLAVLGKMIPVLGKYFLPILMNVTHFILFSISIYQLKNNTNEKSS